MRKIQTEKQNPFAVPEGYFEALPGRVMSALPAEPQPAESPTPTIVVSMPRRHWMGWAASCAAAACIACAVMFTRTVPQASQTTAQRTEVNSTETYDEEYQAAVLEYAMVDNQAIYSYLSGNY